nr:pyruvate kinase [Dubosiella newyorkensis]
MFGTFGPTLHTREQIIDMIELGMNGIRLNCSHVSLVDAKEWIDALHEAMEITKKHVELVVDLKGPEIRVLHLKEKIRILPGEMIKIEETFDLPALVKEKIDYQDQLQVDDGKLLFEVKKKDEEGILLETIRGGTLYPHKSVAIEGKEIVLPPLCQDDIETIKHISEFGVEGVLMPFVRSERDLIDLKETLDRFQCPVKIYGKIESRQGVENIRSLLPYMDEVVIARGDLGNAVGLCSLPIVQHEIETICRKANKPYMIVTQLLEMVSLKGIPSRAEVDDIFHAIYQGASSIMLTGEVANSKYAKEAMHILCEVSENTLQYKYKER